MFNPATTRKEFTCFHVSIGLVYPTEKGLREMQLEQHFLAPSNADALRAAVAWAREREKALNLTPGEKHLFSSIRVGSWSILAPEQNGFIKSGYNGYFFEWKIDWPGTLDEYVAMASTRMKARRK